MKLARILLAVSLIVAVHVIIASAQSLAEIEQLSADIAKDPKSPLLATWYIKRGMLYTWNGSFYTKPAVERSQLSADVDSNRAKALADAESALKLGEDYRAYHLRGLVRKSLQKYDDARKDFERAAKLKSETFIVANIFRVDTSSGKVVYPYDLERIAPAAVIFKGVLFGTRDGYATLIAAKDDARKLKRPSVVMLDKQKKTYFLYEAQITDNVPINVALANTPLRKAVQGKSKLTLTYEALKIDPNSKVQMLPKEADIDEYNYFWEIVDIIDAEALSLIKKTNMQLMSGSRGIRILFESEIERSSFDEAVKIYMWLDRLNANVNDLDVVKITRKTNLSKLYRASDTLKPFVEKEMTKWNYTEAEKVEVRGVKR